MRSKFKVSLPSVLPYAGMRLLTLVVHIGYSSLRYADSPLSQFSTHHLTTPHRTEKRKAEAERIRQKYPDRIPVSTHSPPHRSSISMVTDRISPTGHLRESRPQRHRCDRQTEVPRAICTFQPHCRSARLI